MLSLALGPGGAENTPHTIEVSTTTLTIPTYPYAGFLQTRHSAQYNMDYPWLHWGDYEASGLKPVLQDYTLLAVENAWLQLTFLPELGGRLYGIMDKASGEQILYQNRVIKPTSWGPPEQGWWLAAGGIEWCLPVEEHGYEWGVPWDYSFITSTAGVTVTLQDSTASDRLRAQILVHLPADQAAFRISPRLENPTGTEVTFKYWHNAQLAPGAANTVGPDLRFVVPIDLVTVHSRGDDYLPGDGQAMSWPVHSGTDYSRLGNWNEWLGFFARPQAARDWAGVYDEDSQRGLARVFPRQVATGVKGFGFGWQTPIDPERWTDDESTYVELHGGPSPTFWDSITLAAGESMEWTETWLPVQDVPALSLATSDVALGLRAVGPDLHLGFVVAGQRNDVGAGLWRKLDCVLLWEEHGLTLSPGEVVAHQLPGLNLSPDQVLLGIFDEGKLLVATDDLTCLPPTSEVDPLTTVQTATDFVVSWTAADPAGTLESYDIQVRDGDSEAAWTDWLTETTVTAALFGGQDGRTYAFRSRARDIYGQVEVWPEGSWQDTFTTVLLQPAPMLITSEKTAQPADVQAGEVLEFEISLRNTGNLEASVQITDPLPAYLDLVSGPVSSQPPDPVFISHTVFWSGTMAAGQTDVSVSFGARLADVPRGGIVSNTVWIDDGVFPVIYRQVTARGWLGVYLPMILK
jgi:uncharacterized repeat protein (TIGR01451 family)